MAGSGQRSDDQVLIPEGKVEKVCKEWLVKEDSVLAYQLQNEEISKHYNGNRFNSKLLRHDRVQAKTMQDDEERELMLRYQQELYEQERRDEEIAKEIQDRLIQEEETKIRQQMHINEEDERLAQRLQTKEREKLMRRRLEKEKQQVEKIRAQKLLASELQGGVNPIENSENNSAYDMNEVDLSEFCMKPPPGLNEEELRVFKAEQDSEIASFLQQHEIKRKNQSGSREKLLAIEAHDHEIAKILQEEERAKARRIREKIRFKQLQRQQEREHRQQQEPNYDNKNDDDERSDLGAVGGNIDLIRRALPPVPNFHNVAMDLDPTYNRRDGNSTNLNDESLSNEEDHYGEMSVDETSGIHYAHFARVSPSSSPPPSPSAVFYNHPLPPPPIVDGHLDTMGSASDPGLMGVVAGQKRSSKKEKQKKNTKDGCKTQ